MPFLKNINNTEQTDQELVQLYKQDGDTRVLGELYQRYMDVLYAVCLKYLKEPEAAKDAVMGIFEELIPKMLKHEVGFFRAWLYTVARNYCLMQLRSQKKMPESQITEIMQIADSPHLNGIFENEEHLNKLAKCMDNLSPEQKQTVRMFYLEEKCYKEIAGLTQMDWNKVRSLIQNARRNLKICMEKNTLTEK